MVMRGLAERGWDCRALPQPVLERDRGGVAVHLHFALQLLAAWARSLRMVAATHGSLCVNLGQTRMAFLRDGLPLLIGWIRFGRARIVISLHGSLFMRWPVSSLNARLFRFLLRRAGTVTVLGERQRERLSMLGIDPASVEIVINSCAMRPMGSAQLSRKLARVSGPGAPLKILHLSSLIATKGFPEYLEALEIIARKGTIRIDAVLCGKVTASEFQDRFPSAAAAERWIEETVAGINRSDTVRVRWVRGAVGAEKEKLFGESEIFVLPTRYAVEAQPIVLLEAMAAGCAIVTTRVGEIPTILDERSAIFLGAGSAAEIAGTFEQFAMQPAAIQAFAEAAHRRFIEHYELSRHLDGWEQRLDSRRRAARPAAAEPVLLKS